MSKFVAIVSKQCVACGTCLKKCPRGAITIRNGVIAEIDESKCVGCGLCEKACPASVISRKERGVNE